MRLGISSLILVKKLIASMFQIFPDRMRGKQRVARWLLNALRVRKNITQVRGDFGLNYILPNLIENVSFEIFINGIFEKETVDTIFSIVREQNDAVILDIGANIGSIALPIAAQMKNIKIYCIEASPRVFKFLEKNIDANKMGRCIFAHNACLSDSDAEYLDFFSPVEQFGKGSLTPVFTSDAEKVRNLKLDEFIRKEAITKVDFIKIDVEGFETQVFKSGAYFLSKSDAPDILFEVCDWAESLAGNQVGDSQRILKQYGYRLFDSERANAPIKDISSAAFAMILASKKLA
jgi:FkbM family methyltransferase